ncbi:hypothetical protein Xen7305DRAFT_00052960 [Xenococcus sp. PCC 7305]|uniref:hypothetical protein n=1 Tax=Xenococcus sp. PCC 7305 TaxID=102125 RepID=UPI0002AC6E89|nr:hypothetical protein [Xenococcus sp. PCC 7305]ELS05549.1 hypothetical protein Xen7305DRAFT_00052960 [Xenococcus sp. PCC 7305]
MSTTSSNQNILSFILALSDFSESLTVEEQKTLKNVGKQFAILPEAWEEDIQPQLLKTIANNPQLNKSYQFYKKQLATKDIPEELLLSCLPSNQEISKLSSKTSNVQARGFKSSAPATGFQQQLNNVVIVVCESDKSEDVVKKISSFDKLKQFITKK